MKLFVSFTTTDIADAFAEDPTDSAAQLMTQLKSAGATVEGTHGRQHAAPPEQWQQHFTQGGTFVASIFDGLLLDHIGAPTIAGLSVLACTARPEAMSPSLVYLADRQSNKTSQRRHSKAKAGSRSEIRAADVVTP